STRIRNSGYGSWAHPSDAHLAGRRVRVMSNCIGRFEGAGRIGALAIAVLGVVACAQADKLYCDNGNCGWSGVETERLSGLADLPAAPPVDTSKKYFGVAAAER